MASSGSSYPTIPVHEMPLEFPSEISGPSTAPRTGQTVFEQIPSAKVTQSRRVVITTLLILANIVQVGVYFNISRQFGIY